MAGKRTLEAPETNGRKKLRPETLPVAELAQHFSRTVHTFVDISDVIEKGLEVRPLSNIPENPLSVNQRRDFVIFKKLLEIIPVIEEFIEDDNIARIAPQVQTKMGKFRSQDANSLKLAILDLVLLLPGYESNLPPTKKTNRGFCHDPTGSPLCPVGIDWCDKLKTGKIVVTPEMWPIFVYADHQYDPDNPQKGLFRGALLVMVFKHIFLSPAFARGERLTKRPGHAVKHNMTCVTPGSIAKSFDADSKRFYNNILKAFGDTENYTDEVIDLLAWWDRQIFLNSQDEDVSTINALRSTVSADTPLIEGTGDTLN
ncbi:hypothetical protein BDZ94DRAFT_1310119 [Collybia nuda]|uniref:Uncharacterized protein n=1 Tax=Collybia nuda TaxID=64659 RepID=A0A9P6CII5_9AGAR|nr:hypothetical protein BDZ94DRAFT_1310119 [Collybia nuda]